MRRARVPIKTRLNLQPPKLFRQSIRACTILCLKIVGQAVNQKRIVGDFDAPKAPFTSCSVSNAALLIKVRPKASFFAHDGHIVIAIGKNSWANEIAAVHTFGASWAARDQTCAFFDALFDHALDFFKLNGVYNGANVAPFVTCGSQR